MKYNWVNKIIVMVLSQKKKVSYMDDFLHIEKLCSLENFVIAFLSTTFCCCSIPKDSVISPRITWRISQIGYLIYDRISAYFLSPDTFIVLYV